MLNRVPALIVSTLLASAVTPIAVAESEFEKSVRHENRELDKGVDHDAKEVDKGVKHDADEVDKGLEHDNKERHDADKHLDKAFKKDL